jgi:hypothetical protein
LGEDRKFLLVEYCFCFGVSYVSCSYTLFDCFFGGGAGVGVRTVSCSWLNTVFWWGEPKFVFGCELAVAICEVLIKWKLLNHK